MPTLEERVAALEARASGSGADFIGFSDEFDGEIIASGGIAIPASDSIAPPNARRIRWYRFADGAVLAQDFAVDEPATFGGLGGRHIEANPAAVYPNGRATLIALTDLGARTGIVAEAWRAAAPNRVSVFVGGVGSILWDSAGASDWQRDAQPTARVRRSVAQSIPTAAWTPITFDTPDRMLNGFVFDGAQPTRLTIPKAGVYTLTANVRFDNGAGGVNRGVSLRRNGVASGIAKSVRPPPTAGNFPNIALPGEWRFAANDYVELYVFQDTGAAMNVQADEEDGILLAATRLSA